MKNQNFIDTKETWAVKLINEHCYNKQPRINGYVDLSSMDWVMLCLLDIDFIPMFLQKLPDLEFDVPEAVVLMKNGIETILPDNTLEELYRKLNSNVYSHYWPEILKKNKALEKHCKTIL